MILSVLVRCALLLTVGAKVLRRSPIGLPARLRLRSGVVISLDPATATTLQQAAATAAGF